MVLTEKGQFHVKFEGACGEVTGSCHHLKYNGEEFLVDCGMSQGEKDSDWHNAREFPFDPKKIKYVFLTHGHIDHCGLIPKLVKSGFVGQVYCTVETKEIAEELLKDSAKIMQQKQKKTKKNNGADVPVLFTQKDVGAIQWNTINTHPEFKWGKVISLSEDLRVAYNRQSHVLGSVSLTFLWQYREKDGKEFQRSIHFTGDIGNNCTGFAEQSLLKRRQEPMRNTEYIVTESTYGGRFHDSEAFRQVNRLARLSEHIRDENYNQLVIPCFSFQRTQDMLFDLLFLVHTELKNRNIEVIVHSPLGEKISKIFAACLFKKSDKKKKYEWLNEQTIEFLKQHKIDPVKFFDDYRKILLNQELSIHCADFRRGEGKESEKELAAGTTKIVVASAGMCDQGPVINYLDSLLPRKNAKVLLCGYQAKGTFGGRLQEYAQAENKNTDETITYTTAVQGGTEKTIFYKDIQAKIDFLSGYSGHADTEGMLKYLFADSKESDSPWCSDKKIFLVHGGLNERSLFEDAIKERARIVYDKANVENKLQVIRPKKDGGWYDLNNACWADADDPNELKLIREEIKNLTQAMYEISTTLKSLLQIKQLQYEGIRPPFRRRKHETKE